MTVRHPLLEFIGSRYVRARSSSDELHLRALELIAAACVREWVDLPAQDRSVAASPPQGWIQDSAPPVPQEPAAAQPQPPDAVPKDDAESWWGAASDQAAPDHAREGSDPPART